MPKNAISDYRRENVMGFRRRNAHMLSVLQDFQDYIIAYLENHEVDATLDNTQDAWDIAISAKRAMETTLLKLGY